MMCVSQKAVKAIRLNLVLFSFCKSNQEWQGKTSNGLVDRDIKDPAKP